MENSLKTTAGTEVRIVVDQHSGRNAYHAEAASYHNRLATVVGAETQKRGTWEHEMVRVRFEDASEALVDASVLQVLPKVGMVATYGVGSDRYVTKVLEVSRTGHRVVTEDGVYTRRSDGRYRRQGWTHNSIAFGVANEYRDPSF